MGSGEIGSSGYLLHGSLPQQTSQFFWRPDKELLAGAKSKWISPYLSRALSHLKSMIENRPISRNTKELMA